MYCCWQWFYDANTRCRVWRSKYRPWPCESLTPPSPSLLPRYPLPPPPVPTSIYLPTSVYLGKIIDQSVPLHSVARSWRSSYGFTFDSFDQVSSWISTRRQPANCCSLQVLKMHKITYICKIITRHTTFCLRLKVHMKPLGTLLTCDVYYISRRIAISCLQKKPHLDSWSLKMPELTSFKAMKIRFLLFQATKVT